MTAWMAVETSKEFLFMDKIIPFGQNNKRRGILTSPLPNDLMVPKGGFEPPRGLPTTPSRWRVYQFHHFGNIQIMIIGSNNPWRFLKKWRNLPNHFLKSV